MRVVAVFVIAGVAAVGAASSPQVSIVPLPSRASFYTVEASGSRLLLSGSDTTGNGCNWLVLDAHTLRVKSSLVASCEQPGLASEPVVPVQFYRPQGNQTSVRIARPTPRPARVSYGPVVMRFPEISDTRLEWTYGPGLLWLYDVATTHGAEVVEISTATGRVVRTVSMPKLVRPLLAADADGLWIAASVETAMGAPAPTYHLAPGAGAPRLVHRGGYAAFWLVAAGHTVWEDTASMSRPSSVRQEIWRFDGSSAAAHALASANSLNSEATPAVQPGSAALWTVSNGPSQPSYDSCAGQQIVRIDAVTGRQIVKATIRVPGNPCFPVPDVPWLPTGAGAQTFAGGAFYFLAQTQARVPVMTLYGVRPQPQPAAPVPANEREAAPHSTRAPDARPAIERHSNVRST